jgi:conjugative transposon TraM protein
MDKQKVEVMENVQYDDEFLRKRRFMTVIPLLVVPFASILFLVLGGGQDYAGEPVAQQPALNIALPSAVTEQDSTENKLTYYERADRDSVKRSQMRALDPYLSSERELAFHLPEAPEAGANVDGIRSGYNSRGPEESEAKVYERLDALNRALKEPQGHSEAPYPTSSPSTAHAEQAHLDRLEAMMEGMQADSGSDPEMAQVNNVLEKILDIQHPDRMREKLRERSALHRGQVYVVRPYPSDETVSVLDGDHSSAGGNGFFAMENEALDTLQRNAIGAVLVEDQTVVNGSTVKLRLTADIYVNGKLIPQDQWVYGTANIQGERLAIEVNSILYDGMIFPVQLGVYDLDGMSGIYIPGAITRDVAKESADRSMQSLGLMSLDPSIGAQAMSAGIEATKSLLGKKVKLVKVHLKAGYKVYLKDEQTQGE